MECGRSSCRRKHGADFEGYFGLNVDYKRWSFGANFQYSFGADRYNKTLYEKIEGGNFAQNADRRALTQRWTKPGDVAKYRGYGNTSQLKPTSRFVQKDDFLSMTSARLSYTLNANDLQALGISLLKFTLSTNDLFYVSTIKQEEVCLTRLPVPSIFHYKLIFKRESV